MRGKEEIAEKGRNRKEGLEKRNNSASQRKKSEGQRKKSASKEKKNEQGLVTLTEKLFKRLLK